MKYRATLQRYWREVVLVVLLGANFLVFLNLFEQKAGTLQVYFLDIGQGDAILVETPSHHRLLLDGGPNKKVLSELGRILPFGAKDIDVMIESHPDKDHIGGLPEVMDRYNVGVFLEPGVESTNSIDDVLHARVKAKSIPDILAKRGMVINFGDGVKLKILFPNQSVTNWETNDASIVARLEYGEKSFLFNGDSPTKIENVLLKLSPADLDVDVLKAGHHGSRTSTSLQYAEAASPEYGVISAGTGNTYGHPTKEVLEILKKVGAKIVATETAGGLTGMGTIEFETDGKTLELK